MSDTAKPKWSQGPWSADDGEGSYCGIFDESGDPIAYLAEPTPSGAARLLPGLHPYADRDNYPFAEAHIANAHLIAAAPELYAAAELILVVADYAGNPWAKINEAIKAARTAVAKARAA